MLTDFYTLQKPDFWWLGFLAVTLQWKSGETEAENSAQIGGKESTDGWGKLKIEDWKLKNWRLTIHSPPYTKQLTTKHLTLNN